MPAYRLGRWTVHSAAELTPEALASIQKGLELEAALPESVREGLRAATARLASAQEWWQSRSLLNPLPIPELMAGLEVLSAVPAGLARTATTLVAGPPDAGSGLGRSVAEFVLENVPFVAASPLARLTRRLFRRATPEIATEDAASLVRTPAPAAPAPRELPEMSPPPALPPAQPLVAGPSGRVIPPSRPIEMGPRGPLRPEPPEPPVEGPPGPPRPPRETPPPPPEPSRPPRPEWPLGTPLATAERGYIPGFSEAFFTVASRLKRFGPAGEEIVRLETRTFGDQLRWFRAVIEPLYARLVRAHLTPAQNLQLIRALEGEIPVQSLPTPLQGLARDFEAVFGPRGSAVRSFQEVVPEFQPREHFFMRELPPEVVRRLREDAAYRTETVLRLVERGGYTPAEARRIVNELRGKRILGIDRPMPGEFARTEAVGLPFITDVAEAVRLRGLRMARRWAELRNYGPRDQHLRDLLSAIEAYAGRRPREVAETLVTHLLRQAPLRDEGAIIRTLMGIQAATKLPGAMLLNLLGQPGLILLRANVRTFLRGVVTAFRNPAAARAFADHLGLLTSMALRQLSVEAAGSGAPLARRWLLDAPLWLYNLGERVVRVVAAVSGREWVRQLERRLATATPAQIPAIADELRRLSFSPREIRLILSRRRFTAEEVELAAFAFADQVVYLPRAARRSAAFAEWPIARGLLQFKSFIANAHEAVREDVIRAFRRDPAGTIRRLAPAIPILYVLGEVPSDISALLRGQPRPTIRTDSPEEFLRSVAFRLVDNFLALGVLSFAGDLLRTIAARPDAAGSALAGWALGPSVSMVGEAAGQAFRLGRALLTPEDPAEIRRQLYESLRWPFRQVSPLGQALAAWALPSTGKARRPSVAEILGMGEEAESRARAREARRRRVHQRLEERIPFGD